MFFIRPIYRGLLSTLLLTFCFSRSVSVDTMNTARLLLANVRGGDYVHAVDEAAIDMVLKKVLALSPGIEKGNCLDVGSGLGGTANYFYKSNFHSIYGVDLDQAAVKYAQKNYPQIQFLSANANHIPKLFNREFFSFIYMFNVLYAIEDKEALLKNLYDVAKPGAILVLFDYTTGKTPFSSKDLAGKSMHPMNLNVLEKNLKDMGWETIEINDLSSQFLVWYQDLLDKIENKKEALSHQFSEDDITKVKVAFSTMYKRLKTSQLGGAVIYARKPN